MTDKTERIAGDRREIVRAILVTALAVAAYRLLLWVPLPGLSVDSLFNTDEMTVRSLSVLSIASVGLTAWLTAVTLAELAVLLLPERWTTHFSRMGHADPFSFLVVAAALVITALQGYGVSVAMEQSPNLVVTPGNAFVGLAIASLLGGTAVIVFLARLIDTHGVGMGFWVMLAASFAIGMGQDLFMLFQQALITEFFHFPFTFGVALAVVLGGTAAVVTIVLARRNMALPTVEPVLWPVLLAGTIYPWVVVGLAIVVSVMSSVDDPQLDFWLLEGPIGILVFAAIAFGLAVLYARREGRPGVSLATAGLLAAVVIATMVPIAWANVIPVTAGQLVVIAACGTVVCQAIWHRRFA